MQQIWSFIQDQILGMKWLNELLRTLLTACGLDVSGRIGSSIQFFIYDTIKIFVLLGLRIEGRSFGGRFAFGRLMSGLIVLKKQGTRRGALFLSGDRFLQ